MPGPGGSYGREAGPAWAAPVLIALVAAALRFYALGVPELLHDEALVACAADHDLGYIFHRALHTDAHPPYFYYLAKFYALAGQSEVALRLVSALAGAAAVYALYRLGRRLEEGANGEAAGLFASALLAGHLLHVELSRVLRPHSLTILLAILSAGYFLDMISRRDRASLVKLLLTNLALSFLHFNTLLILGAQMAVAAVLLLTGGLRPMRYGLSFLGVCAAILPVNLWFALLRLGQFSGVDTNGDMAWTAMRSLDNFHSLLALAPVPLASAAGWVLLAAGFVLLFRDGGTTAWALAAFLLLPPLALIAARYGIIYEPWHLAFLLPVLLLACGRALALLPLPARWAAPALAVALGWALLSTKHADVYGPTANMFNHGLGQREVARALPPLLGERTVAAFSDRPLSDFTNWYLRRFSTRDLTGFTLEGPADAGITLVSKALPLGPEVYGARLALALGEPSRTTRTGSYFLHHWRIAREPRIMVDSLPAWITLSPDLEKILRQAASVQDISPVLSSVFDSLAPARYDSPGTFTYRVENRSGQKASGFVLKIQSSNSNPENWISVSVSIDGGPLESMVAHPKTVPNGKMVMQVSAPEGFTTLDITVSMTCSGSVPSFNNMPDTLFYEGMTLEMQPEEDRLCHNLPVAETGVSSVESDESGRFRWGLGPASLLYFAPSQEGEYVLRLSGMSPLPGQSVEVLLDDAPVGRLDFPEEYKRASGEIRFTAQPGNRLLTLTYSRFNRGPGGVFAPDDSRHMGVVFDTFSLRTASPARSKLVYLEQ